MKKTLTVSYNTKEAEGLSDFFKKLDKKDLMHQKMAKNFFQKTGCALKLEQTLVVHLHLEAPNHFFQPYLQR